jgi:hypothetical protein
VLLRFRADFSIDERSYRKHLCDVAAAGRGGAVDPRHNHMKAVLALLGKLPPAIVRPPQVKLPAYHIERLKQALRAARREPEPASPPAAE